MLKQIYWCAGGAICLWYLVAVYNGWKIPLPESSSSGRGSTGYYGGWGGGK